MQDPIDNIRADLFRYNGRKGIPACMKLYFSNKIFRLTCWFRIAQYFDRKNIPVLTQLAKLRYKLLCSRLCIEIPLKVKIGKGFIIRHGFGIVIHSKTIIGSNVTILHNVTIATEKNATPVIGNCVRISPGAVIIGNVTVGDNSVIGANCVVTKNVPANDVAVGNPNKNLGRKFNEFADRHYWKEKI